MDKKVQTGINSNLIVVLFALLILYSSIIIFTNAGYFLVLAFKPTVPSQPPAIPEPQQQMIPENTTKTTNNPSLPFHETYGAEFSGSNEVPPTGSDATGKAEFTAPANGIIRYRVNITGISDASAAHIHAGAEGENGDLVADLLNTPTSKDKDTAYGMIFRGNLSDSSLKGPMQGKTLDDLAAEMDSGKTYVNVHTAEHPDGEVRGQIANNKQDNDRFQ